MVMVVSWDVNAQETSAESERLFESKVRPVLVERCHKCHAGTTAKGGLRVDTRDALLKGGESGAAIIAGKPDESLLLQAVRHQNGLAMPPNGRLTESQIATLAEWIRTGAVFPVGANPVATAKATAANLIVSTAPNVGELAKALQLWLRADSLTLNDGEAVHIWPDQSGHGRDASATKGVRIGGVGMPARFVRESTLLKRPGVRFDTSTGLASSPDRPVDVHGDAALTIMLVMNLQPHEAQPPYDGVFGIGNPAFPGDPGRPLAALVQINRGDDHAMHFAGGWNHDAALGAGSFKSRYGQTIILTVTKRPGPMRSTTRIFINGEDARSTSNEDAPLEGRDGIPDIQHRTDIGAYLGKALSWSGAIQGDVGEVILYNRAISDTERLNVESHLAEKFGLLLKPLQNVAPRAVFTDSEKSFWAYQPVKDVMPPSVNNENRVKNPIDRFILRQWDDAEASTLEVRSSCADYGENVPPEIVARHNFALLRRVTFDLIGLPPTPEEVDAFVADDSPQAYENVVNRLLDSPHYGERWARHWLDVVRYAESTANDANAVMRFAWRYRNYVIDAFNSDLPYDQFLIEQLAGDLLPPTDSVEINSRRIIATGYLMIGPKALAETDKEQSRLDIVDDQIDVTGRAMLGLTIACARCHDHKFDAIRTTDYYALAGIFRSTEPFQNEVRNASMWWEFPVSQGPGKEPITVMAPKETQPRNLRVHLRGNRFTLGATVPRGFVEILASRAASAPGPTTSVDQTHSRQAPGADAARLANTVANSGRLELARWIASPSNPLTARVMVNRLWQHHFGKGVVETSDNFGTRGERPSNPELLDWLATRFVDSGWRIKDMHRLMVLSGAYQQPGSLQLSESSGTNTTDMASKRSKLTATNQTSSSHKSDQSGRGQRFVRRLSAEELRDAMLFVSGKLDRTPGSNESGEFLVSKAENIGAMIMPNRVTADDPYYTTFTKRSIYLPIVRNMLPDVLALFDAADPNGVTTQRNETTVASQSLFLLNSPFVRDQSKAFAERLLASDKLANDDQRIAEAHRLAFGRTVTVAEQTDAREFLATYQVAPSIQNRPANERLLAAWQSYCQSLLCSNEFLYVE